MFEIPAMYQMFEFHVEDRLLALVSNMFVAAAFAAVRKQLC